MAAVGVEEAPAQVDGAAAAVAVGLRFYHLGHKGIKTMGTLKLHGPMPPPPPRGDADADVTFMDDGGVDHSQLGMGMYVALFQGGEIKDLARLSSLEGQPVAEMEEVLEGKSRTSSEEVEKGEDEEEEEEEEVEEDLYTVQVRIWPGDSHAVFILFDDGLWTLTRAYNLSWLRQYETKEFLSMILKDANEIGSTVVPSFNFSRSLSSQLDFEGQLDLDDYVFSEMNPRICDFGDGQPIGDGATCGVQRFFYQDAYGNNAQCAIKVIKLTEKYEPAAVMDNKEPREVAILSSFRDPHVPAFYQAWVSAGYFKMYLKDKGSLNDELIGTDDDEDEDKDDELKDLLFIQMEYCTSTVWDILFRGERQITVEQSWELFEKIVEAVKRIHLKGVIHRDLKPGNIFIGPSGAVKIGDFGHACWAKNYIAGQVGTPNCGTDLYAAPELEDGHITEKVDIYSIGVIFVDIFHPFKSGHERFSALRNLKKSIYPTDWVGDTELLKKLTAFCPSERPSANDVLGYISNTLKRGNILVHPGQCRDAMSAGSTTLTAELQEEDKENMIQGADLMQAAAHVVPHTIPTRGTIPGTIPLLLDPGITSSAEDGDNATNDQDRRT
ncbi:eIF-2-alpha kinase GCN2-like [Phragmites australis]|uniref:eIF-2-alpha kinase GCN2-like n=1 Tax=Phragmites australis TaxID=29695 RepID=UPI002D77ADF2|nr:eIF-2-alpha kinase GCN2-like [Phragmites australis]